MKYTHNRDGASASFWHDSWLFGASPRALAPALYSLSRRKHRCVRDALRGGAWVQDLRSRVSAHLLESFVALRTLIELVVLSPDTRDKFTWRFSSDGRYSASSAYRLQFVGSVQTAFVQLIWKPWATPRCRLFAWLFVQNRLMTADRLLAHGWPNGYFCPLCMRNLQTATHLFIECPFSRQVWAGVAITATAPSLAPSSWGNHHRSIDWMADLSEGLPSLEASRVRSWSSGTYGLSETPASSQPPPLRSAPCWLGSPMRRLLGTWRVRRSP
ncbi:hypothetical protein QYE76_060106 [Lolium multiflorum]|uniref:Reverse transcriptase zinc-binding domain-containing protein n=1 Tax=Lolium multiflorum TaxID=4521 RepID=A0AAD8W3H5_LOLMU|nr:hypothetical protein QYE76_060106 [Lolium multiflorum]